MTQGEPTAERETVRPFPSVLFITRAYPPVRGGMEQLSFDLTTAIAARTRAHIIANRRGKGMLPLFIILAFFRAFFRLPQYEILHIGDPVLCGLAWMLKIFRRRPTAITIHGLDVLYPSRLYQWYLRRFLGCADLYICISSYVEQTVRTQFGIPRTVVIPPGIQDTLYRPDVDRSALWTLLGRDPGARPLLLTVGRLVRRKGVAWFVGNVLPRLPEDVFYAIVGSGPEQAAIETEVERLGLHDRVALLGTISDDALRVLYNTADVYVMPNMLVEHDVEGFGLVALEAASCALPVVASATQGIIDAIYDGRNGILVETADAEGFATQIQRFLDDRAYRQRFGMAARDFTLNHFSWTAITQKYLDTFTNLRRL